MLKPITTPSIYNNGPLPSRMAQCTPDMAEGIAALAEAIEARGGQLVLSDLFRSRDMQLQAHIDHISGKKKAFSPPPGGGMHEAGRAMDIDIDKIAVSLEEFWDIATPIGFHPIISTPSTHKPECWHFDFRGSFQKIYDYQLVHPTGVPAYTRMASLAILEQEIWVDELAARVGGFRVQSALVRLGAEIGVIDGIIGEKCQSALRDLGHTGDWELGGVLRFIHPKVVARFPKEYC